MAHLLYDPISGEKQKLAEPPPREFIEELARRGVPQLETGDVIVATWEPHEKTVLDVIRDQALELQIIFNKGAVMILPTGVNKATGLRAALNRLGLSHLNAVGIGDAENDEAFLKLCDVSAAVDNALDVVKRQVNIVTRGARGAGRNRVDRPNFDGRPRTIPSDPRESEARTLVISCHMIERVRKTKPRRANLLGGVYLLPMRFQTYFAESAGSAGLAGGAGGAGGTGGLTIVVLSLALMITVCESFAPGNRFIFCSMT